MLGWMFVTRRFIEHLQAELEWAKSEIRYEKGRADRMHDLMLSQHLGRAVVTGLPATPAEQAPPPSDVDLARLLQSTDYTQAGMG